MLAYRNRRLCGPTQLRFDGAPVAYRLAAHVGPRNSDHMEMFLTIEVPLLATAGSHEIELYGPLPSDRGGPICGDVPEHHGKIAATTITVGPGPGR